MVLFWRMYKQKSTCLIHKCKGSSENELRSLPGRQIPSCRKNHLAQDFWRQSEVCVEKKFFGYFLLNFIVCPQGFLDHLKSQGSCLCLLPFWWFNLNILVTSQAWFLKLILLVIFSAWTICCFPFIDSLRAVQMTCWVPSLRSISLLVTFKEGW